MIPTKTIPFIVVIVNVLGDSSAIAILVLQVAAAGNLVVVKGHTVEGGLCLTGVFTRCGRDFCQGDEGGPTNQTVLNRTFPLTLIRKVVCKQ